MDEKLAQVMFSHWRSILYHLKLLIQIFLFEYWARAPNRLRNQFSCMPKNGFCLNPLSSGSTILKDKTTRFGFGFRLAYKYQFYLDQDVNHTSIFLEVLIVEVLEPTRSCYHGDYHYWHNRTLGLYTAPSSFLSGYVGSIYISYCGNPAHNNVRSQRTE